MRDFIKRKDKLFSEIQNKKGNSMSASTTPLKKYRNVSSRVFKTNDHYSSVGTLPVFEKSTPKKQSTIRK